MMLAAKVHFIAGIYKGVYRGVKGVLLPHPKDFEKRGLEEGNTQK